MIPVHRLNDTLLVSYLSMVRPPRHQLLLRSLRHKLWCRNKSRRPSVCLLPQEETLQVMKISRPGLALLLPTIRITTVLLLSSRVLNLRNRPKNLKKNRPKKVLLLLAGYGAVIRSEAQIVVVQIVAPDSGRGAGPGLILKPLPSASDAGTVHETAQLRGAPEIDADWLTHQPRLCCLTVALFTQS